MFSTVFQPNIHFVDTFWLKSVFIKNQVLIKSNNNITTQFLIAASWVFWGLATTIYEGETVAYCWSRQT